MQHKPELRIDVQAIHLGDPRAIASALRVKAFYFPADWEGFRAMFGLRDDAPVLARLKAEEVA